LQLKNLEALAALPLFNAVAKSVIANAPSHSCCVMLIAASVVASGQAAESLGSAIKDARHDAGSDKGEPRPLRNGDLIRNADTRHMAEALFPMLDQNQDGHLSRREAGALGAALGGGGTAEADAAFKAMDGDGDGLVNEAEAVAFFEAMESHLKGTDRGPAGVDSTFGVAAKSEPAQAIRSGTSALAAAGVLCHTPIDSRQKRLLHRLDGTPEEQSAAVLAHARADKKRVAEKRILVQFQADLNHANSKEEVHPPCHVHLPSPSPTPPPAGQVEASLAEVGAPASLGMWRAHCRG